MKHSSFLRVYELDRWIQQGKLESAEQFAREFQVSTRTIERDLDELRVLGAQAVYDKKRKRYAYLGKPVTLPAQWLTEKDFAILLIAEKALRIHPGLPFQKEIHPAFNRLLNPVRHDNKMMDSIRELCKSVMFHRPYKAERNICHEFSRVLDAIMDKKRLSFGYRSAEGKITMREVDPYVLINDGGDWYLVGHCKLRNDIRNFALDRIFNPRIIDFHFALPKGFKPEEYLKQGFGRMRGKDDVDVRLQISGRAVAWIERNVWHPTQKIEKKRDGSILLSLKCPVTDNLVRWVLQMAGDVRILAPEGLRVKAVSDCGKLIANN